MDSETTLLYQYGAPTGSCLEPAESSEPILSSGYELRPGLIELVQEQPFTDNVSENPYTLKACLMKL
jgi:hypothetical protein